MRIRYEAPRECAICGRNGNGDPLDRHHVFGGCNRKLSEKYGAVVYLCHSRCHEYGPLAVHRNRASQLKLQAREQERIMAEQGWDEDDFRAVFGKSYLGGGDDVPEAVAL